MNKHILHITDGIYPISIGGMQKYAAELTKALLEADEQLTVTLVFTDYLLQYKSSDEKRIQDYIGFSDRLNLIYVPFPQAKLKLPMHYYKESKLWSSEVFKSVGDQNQYDIVYAHGFSAVAKPVHWKVPVVVNLHGLNMFQKVFGWKKKLVAHFLRKLAVKALNNGDGAVSLGGKLTPIIQNNFKGKIQGIPVGINTKWIAKQPKKRKERPVFLFVGRQDPVKGLDLFVNASNKVKEADFWVVGTKGTDKSNLKYHGPIYDENQLKEIYDQVDFYVSCGYSEGMPIAILEAFARGVPVIASGVGASSVLVNDKSGWVFESGNQDQLIQGVRKAVKDKEYESKSVEALRQAKMYNWETVAKQHLSFFDSLS